MERNGSIFIKLGQHLSSMNYLLPLEWTTTFVPLQDHCPVSSYESIENMFHQDTGSTIASRFETFDQQPIGAASLAQVHLATLKNGERVAVKVQHPALEEWVPLDLALTKFTFSSLKKWFPEYDLEWLSSEMETSLPQELDFALEGRLAMQTKKYFETLRDTPLIVPDVKWSSRRILIMEYVSGHRADDLQYLDAHGIDRDEVSAALARIFNEMIFGDTPLHCDPHGGNIAVRQNTTRKKPNFDIVLYGEDFTSFVFTPILRYWVTVRFCPLPIVQLSTKCLPTSANLRILKRSRSVQRHPKGRAMQLRQIVAGCNRWR